MTKKSKDYYGVELKEKRYVFLVDISGSMENKIEKDGKGQVIDMATNKAADVAGELVGGEIGGMISSSIKKSMTKLEKAKKKIIPVINGFTEENYFTIMTFENNIKMWKKEMVQATSANKKKAVAYIKMLKAGGGTNISDALEESLKLAGDGTKDSTITLNVETVFLLTDGVPSAGQFTNTEDILKALSGWNSLKRVIVHSVGLGDNHDKVFLEKMAEQNNGIYIDK
jgi:uncharacterized protein YegL